VSHPKWINDVERKLAVTNFFQRCWSLWLIQPRRSTWGTCVNTALPWGTPVGEWVGWEGYQPWRKQWVVQPMPYLKFCVWIADFKEVDQWSYWQEISDLATQFSICMITWVVSGRVATCVLWEKSQSQEFQHMEQLFICHVWHCHLRSLFFTELNVALNFPSIMYWYYLNIAKLAATYRNEY
jgi:hypothetical protein